MCQEVKVTAGAMLAMTLGTRGMLAVVGAAGIGMSMYALATSSTAVAVAFMVMSTYSAIATIMLLARRANPVRQAAPAPARPAPRRTHARVIASRTAPALDAASLDLDAAADAHRRSRHA